MIESAGRYDQILIDKFYYRAQFLSTISDNIVFNGNEGITEGIFVIILLIYIYTIDEICITLLRLCETLLNKQYFAV